MYPKGQRKRAEIVSAACEAFSVAGYRNASIVQIAAHCGVSRAGLAHHFPTKEALLGAVLQERDRVNAELFFQGVNPSADGLDYLARLVRLIEHNASTPGAVGLYVMLAAEASDLTHPAHDYFTTRYRRTRDEMQRALAEILSRGLIRSDVDIVDLDSELIGLIDGLQIQWLLDQTSVDMAARLRHRLREILTVPLC